MPRASTRVSSTARPATAPIPSPHAILVVTCSGSVTGASSTSQHAVALAVEQLGRDLHGEPRLAGAAGADEGEQTSAADERLHVAKFGQRARRSSSRHAEGCDETPGCPATATPESCRRDRR